MYLIRIRNDSDRIIHTNHSFRIIYRVSLIIAPKVKLVEEESILYIYVIYRNSLNQSVYTYMVTLGMQNEY